MACKIIYKKLSGGYFYENILETEQGVFLIGRKENQIQKLHYNSQLTSLLSKSQSVDTENTNYER
jgi:hypothetical protein